MHLAIIQPAFIDKAWKDGAACLEEACKTSGGEIEGPQLKMILSRGERTLVALVEGDKPVGWGVWRIDQLPNIRVLHCTDLVAHNAHFEAFFFALKQAAEGYGCSEIRCCAKPAQARLYKMKLGMEPVYETLRIAI
jgi:hypothetical protein